jgi:ribosome biogenesis SPOUT family RNA methylase Rps3
MIDAAPEAARSQRTAIGGIVGDVVRRAARRLQSPRSSNLADRALAITPMSVTRDRGAANIAIDDSV